MKTLYLVLFILVSFQFKALSQFEFNNWYFGERAGITFNTPYGSPGALTDGKYVLFEGCAAISDFKGELLFYTEGNKIWNKNHDLIGVCPLDNYSSTQAALIVPRPGDKNIYYLFITDDCEFINSVNMGAGYIAVDMSMKGGSGGIKDPYQSLFSPTTEKLTAARHANGKDYWVITHELNNNIFNVYAVTENGVSLTPVKSRVGIVHDSIIHKGIHFYQGGYGEMKVSPQSDHLAIAVSSRGVVEYFDFDNSTGLISNPRTFYLDSIKLSNTISYNPWDSSYFPYSVAFSPDGTKLYISSELKNIIQLDLSLKDVNVILDSVTQICNLNQRFGMQLGPDGKIYITVYSSHFLDAIEKPNIKGIGCSYKENAVDFINGMCNAGLPNIVYPSSIITTLSGDSVCEGEIVAINLTLNNDDPDFKYSWTGPKGFVSKERNPLIYNATPDMSGWYFVTITFGYYKEIDSTYVVVYPKPDLRIDQSYIDFNRLCTGEESDKEIILKNAGNKEVTVNRFIIKNNTPAFVLGSIPSVIKPGEEKKVIVKFNPNETGYFVDTIVIDVSDLCLATKIVELKGIGSAKVKAILPEIKAGVNDYISIPFTLQLVCGESLPNDIQYEAVIKYEATALYPSLDQDNGVIDGGIKSQDRIINITGSGLESKSIKGTVLLANNEVTPLRIESFRYKNELIETDTASGSLKVIGICRQNLSHVELINGITLSITPHPANEEAEIKISGEKSGKVIVSVYSVQGVKVEEMEIGISGGEVSRKIDLKEYGAGIYQVVAVLDEKVKVEKMVVVK